MSRIGVAPIEVPSGVQVDIGSDEVKVSGSRGELTVPVGSGAYVKEEDGTLSVERESEAPEHKSMHGLTRSLLANAVTGVSDGFTRTLVIAGVGYRAQLSGQDLTLQVGFSHSVTVSPREGVEFEVPQPTTIVVRGIDKQQVGQTAAEIRGVRPPEPYKGKGIRYEDEQIRRKVGKAG